jgi:hypothetical protein
MTVVTDVSTKEWTIPIWKFNGEMICLKFIQITVRVICHGWRRKALVFIKRWTNRGVARTILVFPCTKRQLIFNRALINATMAAIPCLENGQAWAALVNAALTRITPQAFRDP